MRRWFPPLRPESGHLLHLDALRLIASAGIVALHMAVFLDVGLSIDQITAAVKPLSLFVDMFFVVSGFVIAFVYSEKIVDAGSYRSFMRKRLARLAPLHWLTLAIFVGIGLFARAHHFDPNHAEVYDLKCVPVNFLLLHSTGLCPHQSFNSVSWSISAEMIMYVTVPLLFWIMRRNVLALGLMAAAIWVALSTVTDAWYNWASVGGCVRAIPSFALGAYLFGMRKSIARVRFARVGFWIGIWAFFAGCALGLASLLLMLILYATVTFGIAADAQQRASNTVTILAAGGQLTYSSYMLHLLVIVVVLNGVADRIFHTHGMSRNLIVIAAFLAVWPLSYLSLVLFERPAREWLGGKRSKRRVEAVHGLGVVRE